MSNIASEVLKLLYFWPLHDYSSPVSEVYVICLSLWLECNEILQKTLFRVYWCGWTKNWI